MVRSGAYANKINPFVHLDDVRTSTARCQQVVPRDRLRTDLRRLYLELAASPSWRPGILVVVTFDEGDLIAGRARPGGGHVATIVAGPGVRPGRDPTPYSHYALLRSIERRFGLPPLRNASDPATQTIPVIAGARPR